MANWRTAFKSDFLASWDIDSAIRLTIEHVEVKEVQLQKKEKKVVAFFVEKTFPNGEIIKPMILNATNCKKMNMFTGTKETDFWRNVIVDIGVIENTGRIGESKGLSILKVIGSTIDLLEDVKKLYSEMPLDSLTEEERAGIDRVIANEEKNSYDKVLRHLKSKIVA